MTSWDEFLAERNAFWESEAGKAISAQQQAKEDELQAWLNIHPEVLIKEHGGMMPEQWRGFVDGIEFYFRERHDNWHIETELAYEIEPAPNVSTWDEETQDYVTGRYHGFKGKTIAEGIAGCSGYGTTPLERCVFIVNTIRNYYAQQTCDHVGMVNFCPLCGIAQAQRTS